MIRFKSKRELKIAMTFLITLFILGNYLLLSFLFKEHSQAKKEEESLKKSVLDTKIWLADQSYWEERDFWMAEHEPVYDRKSQIDFFNDILDKANEFNIEVLDQRIGEERRSEYTFIRVEFQTKSSMRDLIEWVHTVDDPDDFVYTEDFKCNLEKETQAIKCDLVFTKFMKNS